MKKKMVSLFMSLMCVWILDGCAEASNTYEALGSIAYNDANGCNLNYVTVLVDNKEKMTKEELATAIIEMYISNTLEGIMFSSDEMGYAETLKVEVDEYVKKTDSNEESFVIEYQREDGEEVVYSVEIE